MNLVFPLVIAGIVVCASVAYFIATSSKKNSGGKDSSGKKSRQTIIKDAQKRLKQDPRDPRGLLPLAEIHFQDQAWEKALDLYKVLLEVAPLHPTVDMKNASLRAGICALQVKDMETAFRCLAGAQKENPDDFDVNFYLGQAFYHNNQFDKSIPLLNKAYIINKENLKVHEFLGLSLYEKKDYRKAFPFLKAAFDANPENKKVLFSMADSLFNCGKEEKAMPVFLHLRADPTYGAQACLYAGMYHYSKDQAEKAIRDYEIGLKHENAPSDILTSIRYNLAQTNIATKNLSRALSLLKEIQAIAPGYKDVSALITRYQEMSQNSSLQTYLVAGSSDFLALCRKIVLAYYAKANVKIVALEAKPDVVEIQTEIETIKWEDFVVFRFYRNTGVTGDFVIRDFHGRIRDLKAGKGICLTAGLYTTETKKYVEGRPIDLIDKDGLLKIFNKVANTKAIGR